MHLVCIIFGKKKTLNDQQKQRLTEIKMCDISLLEDFLCELLSTPKDLVLYFSWLLF